MAGRASAKEGSEVGEEAGAREDIAQMGTEEGRADSDASSEQLEGKGGSWDV